MASTTRRKQVVVEKEEIKEEKAPAFPSSLHHEHLRQLEVMARDVENAKLRMALEEQSLRNMILESQILQQKVEKQKQYLQQHAAFYDNSTKQFKQLKSELWPQYGFGQDEGLGYDPATGEIKRP